MTPRDPRFERDTSAPEPQIKMEMERRLARHFERKHGRPWEWCASCRSWGEAHVHEAASHA